FDQVCLVAHHGAADLRKAHRERTSEAATFIRPLQRNILQVLDFPQQTLRLRLETQAAKVTSHVIGDFAGITRAEILYVENVDKRIRQLRSAVNQVLGPAVP